MTHMKQTQTKNINNSSGTLYDVKLKIIYLSVIMCVLKKPKLLHTESVTVARLMKVQFLEDGLTQNKGKSWKFLVRTR